MKHPLMKTPRQFRVGQFLSALGFVAYLAGEALRLPETAMTAVLAVFAVLSVWTLLSILAAPEKADSGVTSSFVVGQTAVTILLAGTLFLTIRQMIRA